MVGGRLAHDGLAVWHPGLRPLVLVVVIVVGPVLPGPATGPGLLAQPPVVLPLAVVKRFGRTRGRGRADVAAAACGLARGAKGDRAVEAFGRVAFLVDGADGIPRAAGGAPFGRIAPLGPRTAAAAIVVIELACGSATARLFDLGQAPRAGGRSAGRAGAACGR